MGPQELQGPQVLREKWEPEETQAEMEKMVSLDDSAVAVRLKVVLERLPGTALLHHGHSAPARIS